LFRSYTVHTDLSSPQNCKRKKSNKMKINFFLKKISAPDSFDWTLHNIQSTKCYSRKKEPKSFKDRVWETRTEKKPTPAQQA